MTKLEEIIVDFIDLNHSPKAFWDFTSPMRDLPKSACQ